MQSRILFAAAPWMPLHRPLIGPLQFIPVFGYHRRDSIFIPADLSLFLPPFSPQHAIFLSFFYDLTIKALTLRLIL